MTLVDLLGILVAIMVVMAIWYIATILIPMDARVRTVVMIVTGILFVIWLLSRLGLWRGF